MWPGARRKAVHAVQHPCVAAQSGHASIHQCAARCGAASAQAEHSQAVALRRGAEPWHWYALLSTFWVLVQEQKMQVATLSGAPGRGFLV